MSAWKVIGVTGGIGAGKSSFLTILKERYHLTVIYADEVGHELMRPGKSCHQAVLEEYGTDILTPDGEIDRRRLAETAFADERQTQRLNQITHPLIRQEIISQIEKCRRRGEECVILEAALLEQGGLAELCDEVWYIYADRQTRISRLMQTRGYSREQAEQVIARQPEDQEYRSQCDLVVCNEGSIKDLEQTAAHLFGREKRAEMITQERGTI